MTTGALIDETLQASSVQQLTTGGRARRRVAVGALVVALLIGMTLLFESASVHTFAGNSDGATVALEGHAIANGNPLLQGWTISLDSFWSIDALFYGAVNLFVGLGPLMLHLVPALMAALVVLLGAWVAGEGRWGLGAIAGAATVLIVLGLPSEVLAYFLLQGPWHVGTVLWCLVAFAGLSRARFGVGFAVAVIALALGLLGDAVAMTIGVLPVLAAGIAAAIRCRRLRSGALQAGAAVAAVVLALVLRLIASAIGTFNLANRNLPIHGRQVFQNLRRVPAHLAGLFGFGTVPVPVKNGSSFEQALHLLVAALVLVALLWALANLCWGLLRGSPERDGRATWRLDDLLLISFVADLATYVLFSPTGNGNYVRYLTPGVVIATVLAGRFVARLTGALSSAIVARSVALVAVALTGGLAAGMASYLASPAPIQRTTALTRFLLDHHLTSGVGDYWSASIVTVESGGAVTVRPVTNDRQHHLLRYERQSADDWYAGVPFTFLVFDTAHPWRQVNAATAQAMYGPPAHIDAVGSYRILTWSHPLSFSSHLSNSPSPLRLLWS